MAPEPVRPELINPYQDPAGGGRGRVRGVAGRLRSRIVLLVTVAVCLGLVLGTVGSSCAPPVPPTTGLAPGAR